MRRGLFLLFVLFFAGLVCAQPVQIDFFYEPGCHACERIEADLFPEIEERFPDACVIRAYDIGIETNFIYLLQLENVIGHMGPDRGYLIVNKQFLFGPKPSHEEFLSLISRLLNVGQASSLSTVARPSPVHGQAGSLSCFGATEVDPIHSRYSGFTLSAVVVAGLLDGMNPCAISTLVFFMSLLAVSTRAKRERPRECGAVTEGSGNVRNRQLILLGVSYVLASFLTYLALGFGLFRILHLFSGFTTLRSAVEWGMTLVLLVLAALSFRDALRFQKSRDAHDVTLQLSTGMKKRIHSVMRRGMGAGSVILGGLFIGTVVTALESVCTGQVYIPTLVLILKNNAFSEARAWLYLLAYNLMFVLPIVLVFIAVYFGLRTETLLRWSRKNVVWSKTLLGLFFALMAVLIVLL